MILFYFSNFHSTSHLYVRFGFMLLCDIVSVVVCVPFAFAGQTNQDHCVWCGHAHENCRFGRLPFSLLIISWLLKLVIHYHVVFSMPIGHQPNTTLQDIASLRWQRINVKEKDWKEKSTYTWMLSLLSFRQFITIRLLRIGINPDLYLHNYTVKFKFNSWNGLLIQRM